MELNNNNVSYLDYGKVVFEHDDDEYNDGKLPVRLIIEELPDGRYCTRRYVRDKLYDSGYLCSGKETAGKMLQLVDGVDPMQPLIDGVCRYRGINPANLEKL